MKKDWDIKKLKDICRVINGRAYSEDEFFKTGKYKVLRVGNFFTNNTWYYSNLELDEDKYCVDGDLLYAWSASFGPKIWHGEKVIYHYHIWKLETNPCLDKTFFYWWLQSSNMINQFSSDLHGATMHHITKNLMESLSVPLPPLEEQKRIVKILDEKFAQLETIKADAQTNLQNAKDLFQSQLAKAFSNTTWEKKKLRDLTDSSLSYGSSSPSCEYDEKVRYIRITDINDEGFLNEEFVSPKFYDEKHILEDGDVLFARTGATVGKAYCYHNEDGKCVYAGYLIRLRPNQNIVIPDYIYLCTKSKEYEDFIKTSQAAAAQPNVNAEKYGNFEIPLPPLPEQKRIVKELDTLSEKVRQLQEIYTKQIANCDELKQALLQKAFEGEL